MGGNAIGGGGDARLSGQELDDELEVHWIRMRAKEKIAFEHRFEPAKKVPLRSSL